MTKVDQYEMPVSGMRSFSGFPGTGLDMAKCKDYTSIIWDIEKFLLKIY